MKVIRLTTLLDFGGVEKRIVNTAGGSDSEVDFIYVSLGKGGWAERELQKLGKEVIILRQPYQIPNMGLIRELIRLFKQLKPDVVHTSGGEANFHGIIAARMAGVPKIIGEEIGFPNHGFKARMIFKLVYRLAHRVVAISQAVKDKLVQLGELDASKCAAVYNPLQLRRAKTKKWNDVKLRLLMVSRLEPVKNISVILHILNERSAELPEFELRIVGDGTERKALEELVMKLSLTSHISFCGFQADPTEYYLTSDIFILPSFSEGLSNSLQEAMGAGLVCVATNAGGPAELIEHGKTGYLVDPKDKNGIARTLQQAMQMDSLAAAEMGQQARNFVSDRFGVSNYIQQLKDIYSR